MIALVVLAILDTAKAVSTPPPTIVTTKSSPLCNVVRNEVAPTVAGLVIQDRMLRHGGALLDDIAQMASDHATGWADMENLRLGRVVDALAHNNIAVHQMLDKIAGVTIKDQDEEAQLNALRTRLQIVADRQAEALNVLSGSSESISANELAGFTNPMGAAFGRSPSDPIEGVVIAPEIKAESQQVAIEGADQSTSGQAARAEAEKRVMGSLEPVLAHCR